VPEEAYKVIGEEIPVLSEKEFFIKVLSFNPQETSEWDQVLNTL